MDTLIIDRSKWRTGCEGEYKTGKEDTKLLNDSGFMCCLGFECLRRGVCKEGILGVGEPSHIDAELHYLLGDMIKDNKNSEWVDDAIVINDDINITLLEKEILIKQIFSEQNIKVKFIN